MDPNDPFFCDEMGGSWATDDEEMETDEMGNDEMGNDWAVGNDRGGFRRVVASSDEQLRASSENNLNVEFEVDRSCFMDTENSEAILDTESVPYEEVDGIVQEPTLGMEFKSLEEGRAYYDRYAHQIGFCTRKGTHYKSVNNVITRQVFTCSNEGFYKRKCKAHVDDQNAQQVRTPKKKVQTIRTGCHAHIRIRMLEKNRWSVSAFVKEHNHELISCPSQTRFFRSNRKIRDEERQLIDTLHEQNITARQIMDVISALHGGLRNLTFTRKDLSNRTSIMRRELIGVDMSTTIEYFQQIQAKDMSFFYALQVDDNNQVKNIFWVDGKSRRAYQHFGDVVTFDTTYMTNKYSMPFATFIGVNHHRQSILFGCALIRDEKVESFVWIFRTWLEAMFDSHPISILTDQDPAMKEAIKIVFPNTRHRFCQWHIMRKARDHLGVVYSMKDGFEKEFKSCINQCLTVEEFEARWDSMIKFFELNNNSHLTLLYKIREKWVPAYFKNTFFGFMSTTQRSESMNALFKTMVDCHMSIYKFVTQYEKILESRHDREDEEVFRSIHSRPSLWSSYPIEKHAIDVYTRNLFKIFQEQLKLTTSFDLDVEEANSLFKVTEVEDPHKPKARRASYVVTTIASFTTFSCNCKMFEFSGMLCAHVLKVLLHLKIHRIPSDYILKRWTKEAKDGCVEVALAEDITTDASSLKTIRFNALCRKMLKLASEGSTCSNTYSLAIKHMDKALTEVMEMKASIAKSSSTEHGLSENEPAAMKPPSGQMHNTHCESKVKDPPSSQCKGRRKITRFKRPSEAKNSRTCKRCHEKGHNIRTCKAEVDGERPIWVTSIEDSEEDELGEDSE